MSIALPGFCSPGKAPHPCVTSRPDADRSLPRHLRADLAADAAGRGAEPGIRSADICGTVGCGCRVALQRGLLRMAGTQLARRADGRARGAGVELAAFPGCRDGDHEL